MVIDSFWLDSFSFGRVSLQGGEGGGVEVCLLFPSLVSCLAFLLSLQAGIFQALCNRGGYYLNQKNCGGKTRIIVLFVRSLNEIDS